jgi:hypothetical protein
MIEVIYVLIDEAGIIYGGVNLRGTGRRAHTIENLYIIAWQARNAALLQYGARDKPANPVYP